MPTGPVWTMVPGNKWARVAGILGIIACLALVVWSHIVVSVDMDANLKRATAQFASRIKLLMATFAMIMVTLAFFCAQEGFTIIRLRSYPPPGVQTLCRVRSRSGRSALLIGIGHQALSALLLFMAATALWFGFWLWPHRMTRLAPNQALERSGVNSLLPATAMAAGRSAPSR